jgi:hypothetical protein
MIVASNEYHPFAACLMHEACRNGETVRANLDAVIDHGYRASRASHELAVDYRPKPGDEIYEIETDEPCHIEWIYGEYAYVKWESGNYGTYKVSDMGLLFGPRTSQLQPVDLKRYFQVSSVAVADEPKACRLDFHVGVQTIPIGPEYCDDRDHADWWIDMICKALQNVIAAASTPPP